MLDKTYYNSNKCGHLEDKGTVVINHGLNDASD